MNAAATPLPALEADFEDGSIVVVAERRVIMCGTSTVCLEVGTKLIVGSASYNAARAAGVVTRKPSTADEQRDVRAFQGRQAQDRIDDARSAAARPVPPKLEPISIPSLAEAEQALDENPDALREALALLDSEETRCHDGGLPYQSYLGVFEGARRAIGHADKALALIALLTGAAELRALALRGAIAANLLLEQARWSQVHAPAPPFNVAAFLSALPANSVAVIDGRLAIRGRSGLHPQTLQQIEAHKDVILQYLEDYEFVF